MTASAAPPALGSLDRNLALDAARGLAYLHHR